MPKAKKAASTAELEKTLARQSANSAKQGAWLAANIPPKTEAEFLDMLPIRAIDGWTQEMEDDLQAFWAGSPVRAALQALGKRGWEAILAMWRVTVNYQGCLPTDILPLDRFRLQPEWKRADGPSDDVYHVLWSHRLCKNLAEAAMHPLFAQQPKLLRTAIQLAVVLRTDHRGQWDDLNLLHWDPVVTGFVAQMRTRDPNKTVVEVFDGVLAELSDAGMAGLGQNPWAALYAALREKLWQRPHAPEVNTGMSGPFLLRSRDVSDVIDALNDATGAWGLPNPWTSQEWATATAAARAKRLLPTTAQIADAVESVYLAYLQRDEAAGAGAEADPVPGLSQSTQDSGDKDNGEGEDYEMLDDSEDDGQSVSEDTD